jgi:hypothetical protein
MQQSRADSLMFTVYPFYGKVEVSKGKQNTEYWYDYALANVANGKPVILGEVGLAERWQAGQRCRGFKRRK